MRCKIIQIQLQRGVSFAVQMHQHIVARRYCRYCIQIDRCREYLAAVVIRMVAADFRASGGADEQHRLLGAVELLFMPLEQIDIAGGLGNQHTVTVAVQVNQAFHYRGSFQLPNHACVLSHVCFSIL